MPISLKFAPPEISEPDSHKLNSEFLRSFRPPESETDLYQVIRYVAATMQKVFTQSSTVSDRTEIAYMLRDQRNRIIEAHLVAPNTDIIHASDRQIQRALRIF